MSFITAFVFVPVTGMKIFSQIHSVFINPIVQFLKRDFEMFHHVAAIIDQNIYFGNFFLYQLKKISVALRSDVDFGMIVFELPTGRVYIDADNFTAFTKIFTPHLHRPAFGDTYFKNNGLLMFKPGKMAIINLKIMIPFVNDVSLMFTEYLSEFGHTLLMKNRFHFLPAGKYNYNICITAMKIKIDTPTEYSQIKKRLNMRRLLI